MEHDTDRLLTSHEVGQMLQMNPSSINKWVNDGRIHAFRTPGGHRRIRAGDLITFLEKHDMPVPRQLSELTRKRLLLVDDDVKLLDSMKRRLKPYANRVQVATATHGIDALIQLGAFKPHVMLLDVYMPELDGLEVCRRVSGNTETRGVRIIVTSGALTKELEKDAAQAGAHRVVAKPIEMSVLLEDLGLQQQATS